MAMKGRVALVVDDSPETLGMLNDALEQTGINVLLALDGQQALLIAERIRPDIVLLDAIMPNLNGFDTCIRFKANPDIAEIPIIFMTGLSDTDSIVKGFEVGGVDYLTKPINPEELIARIQVHVGNAERTQSVQHALDRLGQHLFSIDDNADLVWASEQANSLMRRAGIEEPGVEEDFYQQILLRLKTPPITGQSFKIQAPALELEVILVGSADEPEKLLKLLDPDDRPNAGRLREALPLTEREAEVLFWIANGKTNRDIAEILDLSPRTINKHLETIFPKLGVENRTAAAAIAFRILESV